MSTSTVPVNRPPARSVDRLKRCHTKAFDPLFLRVASMLADAASCRGEAHAFEVHEMNVVCVCRWLRIFCNSHAELLRSLPDRSTAARTQR